MAKLYLDEDMSSRVAQALRSKGFDVVSSHEVGNDGLSDEEQLGYVTKEGRHLVTYNAKDFLALANQWYQRGRRFPKILILREDHFPRHDLGAQIKTLEEFLNRSAQDLNLWDCVEFL
jgi:predicted nuclease of predicted toxin-antitoxin system